jgi:hypothetical protein
MKRKIRFTVFALFSFPVITAAAEPELLWEARGLQAPESVVFDAGRGQFYVSNMATFGDGETAHDGFVARVSADGKLLEEKWVTGLDNPKGLALVNGRLYAGDDVYLWEIDIAAGKIVGKYAPEDGPGDFNDCTADPAGNVYVCSGRLETVFRLHEGKFEAWYKLDRAKTGGLNGLLAEKDRLLLGGWSLRGADGKEQLGHISTVAYADKALGRIGRVPVAHIDGLEPDGAGGYSVCDWQTGDVVHVSADGVPTPIMKLHQGSADHTYLIAQKELVIPLMLDGVLRAYRWEP